jgi:hypothetical protein
MDDWQKIRRLRLEIAAAWEQHEIAIAGRVLTPADVAVETQIHRMEAILQALEERNPNE